MPKTKKKPNQKEQSQRFRGLAQNLADVGDLDLAEAEDRLDRLVQKVAPARDSVRESSTTDTE